MSEYQPFNDKWGVQWVATISCPQQQQSKQNHYSDMFRTALAHCYSKEISQNTNRTAVGNSQALVWEQSASSQGLRNVSLSAAFPRVWNLESRNAIALHCGWPCSHIHLALALTMGVGVASKGLGPIIFTHILHCKVPQGSPQAHSQEGNNSVDSRICSQCSWGSCWVCQV